MVSIVFIFKPCMGVKDYVLKNDNRARENLEAETGEQFGPLCVCPECLALTGQVQYVLMH